MSAKCSLRIQTTFVYFPNIFKLYSRMFLPQNAFAYNVRATSQTTLLYFQNYFGITFAYNVHVIYQNYIRQLFSQQIAFKIHLSMSSLYIFNQSIFACIFPIFSNYLRLYFPYIYSIYLRPFFYIFSQYFLTTVAYIFPTF